VIADPPERTLAKHEVVASYAGKAAIYDVWAELTESRARARALELADVRDGESILEVAVGTGLAFAELLRRNPSGRNEGIDLTEAMLARARQKAERSGATNWRLRVGDAYGLDFADATFHLVLNCYMLDLLPEADFGRVLAEFYRVLRPGGRLVLVNMAPARHLGYTLWRLLYRLNPSWVGGCRGIDVEDAIRGAGFAIEVSERLSQLGFPSSLVCARRPAS
jgi:ubiquinone/menaquinone biosynthesis C-methylase UbiE